MKTFYSRNAFISILTVFIFGAALLAAPAFAAEKPKPAKAEKTTEGIVDNGWSKRCMKPNGKKGDNYCEVYQRMQKGSQRVAEFGIGFPPDAKGVARGAVILPLGMLLPPGVMMKIDDGKPATFKVRYCINEGCFSYLNLDKNMTAALKKGKLITFAFKTSEGRDVKLVMKLNGFEKVFKEIES